MRKNDLYIICPDCDRDIMNEAQYKDPLDGKIRCAECNYNAGNEEDYEE